MQGIGIKPTFDIIEINDGSTDGTAVGPKKRVQWFTPTPITLETQRR